MFGKFNVKVIGCLGVVVFGDNVYLSIGSLVMDGKCGKDIWYCDWFVWYFCNELSFIEFYLLRERFLEIWIKYL